MAAKFLKDPDAEFSSSITPKLGIFPCTFQTGPPAQNSLKFNILERSKRSAQALPNHHLFQDTTLQGLDEQKRKQCREALQRWQLQQQQQRDREPGLSSKGDGLYRFLDQVNKKEIGGMELDEWLGMFANTSQQSFFEFIETYGCPEPKRFLGKGAGWVSGLLDAVCDKKIPNNRAVWLVKYAMLTNLSKDVKMHLAPKGWTDHMLGWLGKLLDTMGKGIDAENKWKRGTSLVRWMFEDGLLSSKSLFDELLKIWRTAFGAISATANGAAAAIGGRPSLPQLSSNKLYSDRVQMLVATELASYVADAIRLGFAKEFYDCAKELVPSVSNESIRPLFELAMSLCQLDLDRDTAQREFWARDRVGLAWELERIKYCLEDEQRLGREVWSAVRRNGFAIFSPLACQVLVDWCTSGDALDALDREERMELVCFAFALCKVHLPLDHSLATCPELLVSVLARQNPQLAPHSPSCLAFCEAMLDCGFEMEAGELVLGLMQIQPPFARVRAVSWLLGKCCNATLHLALLPVMENSLLFKRQLMLANSELRLAIVSRCGAIRQDVESRRLGELLRITSVSPAGGAGHQHTGGATGTTMLFMGPPLTPQFPNNGVGSVNPASGLGAGAGGGGGGQRKRLKQQNTLLHGVEFELREDPSNSPAPNTPSHLSGQAAFTPALLHATGYSGQVARYEFGLHKLGGDALDRLLEELRMDPGSAARLFRDFTCCRDTSKERGVILNEVITGGWNLEDAVSFGLVSLEEVLLEWISKRQVPPTMPLCPSTSNVLVQQQWKQLACFKSPSATLFRLVNHFMLLGKSKSEAFAEMYKSLGREWISQGPGAQWQKDTKRFSEELKEMLRPAANGAAAGVDWRDAWTLARSSWFVHSQDAERLREGLDAVQSSREDGDGDGVAANVAAICKAWDQQDVVAQKQLAGSVSTTGDGLLLARLLSLGGPKLNAVCKEVALANLGTGGDRHLAAGALFHAPIGTLAAEDALERLAGVADVCDADGWRVAVELLRQASPMHQSDVQSFGVLQEAWRLIEASRGSSSSWYALVCKALREEPLVVVARTRAENLIRLGPREFVDAWFVLECAHDTLANQTFLRVSPQVGGQPPEALL